MSDEAATTTDDGHAGVSAEADLNGQLPHAPIRPLMAVGVVVTKAALLDALRLYVPGLLDVEPLDRDRFFLRTAPDDAGPNGGR